jgi:hypothetical protein
VISGVIWMDGIFHRNKVGIRLSRYNDVILQKYNENVTNKVHVYDICLPLTGIRYLQKLILGRA